MKISDFLNSYNLHDSLLENCIYKSDSKELIFEIDFCFWAQENFKEGDVELGIVLIHFFEVSEFIQDDYKINSDSIISIKQTEKGKLELIVETDERDIHIFSFKASSVKFSK